jgi:leader peptidase (prepilin peptidase)/N-methyltransferase
VLSGLGDPMIFDTEALRAVLSQPLWLAGSGLAFGLVIGSFLNVVIHRLPLEQSVVFPPSHCPECDERIRPWDNIPILSYLVLRGHCRGCGTRISPRYPGVELLTGVTFALVALRFGLSFATLIFAAFAAGLIVAAMVDFDHQIIPDEVSVGGLALGLILVPVWQISLGEPVQAAIFHSVAGALLGGGMLWSVGFLHARLSVAMGREFEHWPGEGEEIPRFASVDYWTWFPGIGFGDVKLMAMIGAFLGPIGVVTTVVFASVLGLALGLVWALVTRSWNSPFGFGPAIAMAGLIALLVPDPYALMR